jgi:hypothetical protein
MTTWTGEGIVDQILAMEKDVVYFPVMANCFNQWIALREIHERKENKRFHGRVRCAIKVAPERLGAECKTVEKGWEEGRGWEAYKIIEVRQLFTHCVLKQSVEGKPWRVFTDDYYLAETAKLIGAIQMGTTITEVMAHARALNKQRKHERAEGQGAKTEKRHMIAHYEEQLANKKKLICCEKLMCMTKYKCSLYSRENISTIQFLETNFWNLVERQKEFLLRVD